MISGIRLNKKLLLERFHISSRLAVRIGALLAKKVEVTQAVLEMAASGSEVEKLLLKSELLNSADSLNADSFKELSISAGCAAADICLAIRINDNWKTIALEEEILAEKGWAAVEEESEKEEIPSADLVVRLPDLPETSLQGITYDQAGAEILTSQDIHRLRLALLTSADSGEKIEALGKLVYSAISVHEKALILSRALSDEFPNVRRAAAEAMKALGLSHELMDTVSDIAAGEPVQKEAAMHRLPVMLPEAEKLESVAALIVLLNVLKDQSLRDLHSHALTALRSMAATIAADQAYLREALRVITLRASEEAKDIATNSRILVRELAKHREEAVCRVLWDGLSRLVVPETRRLVCGLLGELQVPEDITEPFAETLAKEAAACEESDMELWRLRSGLVRLGDLGARAIMGILPRIKQSSQTHMLSILDAVCVQGKTSKVVKNQAAQLLLDSLRVADRHAHSSLITARLPSHPDVKKGIKKNLAVSILSQVHEYHMPEYHEQVSFAVERMGADAIDPAFDSLTNSLHNEERELAAVLLGRIISGIEQPTASIQKKALQSVDECRQLLDNSELDKRPLTRALGLLGTSTAISAQSVQKITQDLLQRIWKVTYTPEIFDALGNIGSGPHAKLKLKIELTRIFLDLLSAKLPEDISVELETDEGTVYEFKPDADVYTDILPAAICGLGKIFVSSRATVPLRRKIINALLQKWRDVVNWRVVWGPLAVEELAVALQRIGCHTYTSDSLKTEILRALEPKIRETAVQNAIAEICQQAANVETIVPIAIKCAENLIDIAVHSTQGNDRDERSFALSNLAKIATIKRMDDEGKANIRGKIVRLLFDGLKEALPQAHEGLRLLRDCDNVPAELRRDIADRLSHYETLIVRAPL